VNVWAANAVVQTAYGLRIGNRANGVDLITKMWRFYYSRDPTHAQHASCGTAHQHRRQRACAKWRTKTRAANL